MFNLCLSLKTKTNMEKKKISTTQKKVVKVMHEFKEGELHAGKSNTIVTNRKQAIAIALSEAKNIENLKK